MREDIKELWVAALRSGKYTQGHGCLLRQLPDDTFQHCCLGVLTDLYRQEMGLVWTADPDLRDGNSKVYSLLGDEAVLPSEVVRWAGLDQENPDLEAFAGLKQRPPICASLAYLNDRHWSYEAIADVIEAYL